MTEIREDNRTSEARDASVRRTSRQKTVSILQEKKGGGHGGNRKIIDPQKEQKFFSKLYPIQQKCYATLTSRKARRTNLSLQMRFLCCGYEQAVL